MIDDGVRCSNPDRDKTFSLQNVQTGPWSPPIFLLSGYRGSFLMVNRPGREANHLGPCSAEVMNEGSCNSTAPLCLFGADRDKLCMWMMARLVS
jgi:hypothetical protein